MGYISPDITFFLPDRQKNNSTAANFSEASSAGLTG